MVTDPRRAEPKARPGATSREGTRTPVSQGPRGETEDLRL